MKKLIILLIIIFWIAPASAMDDFERRLDRYYDHREMWHGLPGAAVEIERYKAEQKRNRVRRLGDVINELTRQIERRRHLDLIEEQMRLQIELQKQQLKQLKKSN